MTRKKLTPQQQLRKDIERRVNDMLSVITDMIAQDTPVLVAVKLALCWELEVMYYQLTTKPNQDN